MHMAIKWMVLSNTKYQTAILLTVSDEFLKTIYI